MRKTAPAKRELTAKIELQSKKVTDGIEGGSVVRTRLPVSGRVITYTVATEHNVKTYEAVEGLINVKSTWVLLGKERRPLIFAYDPPPERIIDRIKNGIVRITRTSIDGNLKIPVKATFEIIKKDSINISGCDYAVDVYELRSQANDWGAGVVIRYYYSALLKMILIEDFEGFIIDKPTVSTEKPLSIAVVTQ